MKKNNISYFDLKLFKKVMLYAKPYIKTYYVVLISAILLSLFSTLNPYLLKVTVDDYITPRNYTGLMTFVFLMLMVLLLEVIFQYVFVLQIRTFMFCHFSKTQTLNPKNLQTIFLKPWPGGMRVSD